MSSNQRDTTRLVCIKRIITFSRIPDAENWLHEMAVSGLILEYIRGHSFYFKKGASQCLHYFLLNSDKGSNSENWIYYEFLQMGGKRILYKGSSIMCPRLVLAVDVYTHPDKIDLYQYYYSYRNYRALHRLCRNMFIAILGALACILIYLLQSTNLRFSLQYSGICVLLCIHFVLSTIHYARSSRKSGRNCHWKRPCRPGYSG